MTQTTTQATALVLSALMTLGVVAGMNGIATKQYVKADNLAMAPYGTDRVAIQQVIVVGHRIHA
jgi:hypothetical protein